MSMGFSERNGVLRLVGELTIYHVAELKPQLLMILQEKKIMEIDLSGIDEIDTAGIQLLMLIKKEADRSEKSLRLVAHSPAVLELMSLYDLAEFFGDPLVLTACEEQRAS
jgi:anti-anti-sigma factor